MCSSREETQEKTIPLKGHLCSEHSESDGKKKWRELNVRAPNTPLLSTRDRTELSWEALSPFAQIEIFLCHSDPSYLLLDCIASTLLVTNANKKPHSLPLLLWAGWAEAFVLSVFGKHLCRLPQSSSPWSHCYLERLFAGGEAPSQS